ncbi:MAG: carbohydrate kinase family protein, partial [Tropicimonas sp.]|uniref:carbohydrate kinase family protein n=1 Tax=Tropicimonas sp. TaxID=2067044 RepID=UPI003A844372
MSDPEILCVGMVVVDVLVEGVGEMPRPGETGTVAGVSVAPGGDAINEAVALAKLGNCVGLMGLIGDDAQGRIILERCARHGIGTDGLIVDPNRGTSTGIVLIETGGERSFLCQQRSTYTRFGPDHIDLDRLRPGLKALSVGSLFCMPQFDHEALAPLLRKAKSVGAITFADLVMDERGYGLDDLGEAWPHLDYILPSELEAEIFTGSREPETVAAAFRARGVKNVILKRGTQGVLAFTEADTFACPAFPVPVADTTGAGDNFVGGLIHALVRGADIKAALRFGSAVAALSVQAIGAGAGLKDLAQV